MPSPNRYAVVVLALALATTGCMGAITGNDGGDGGNSALAEDVQQQSLQAMQDVDTYRLTMEMEMNAESSDRTITMETAGAFDRSAEKARVTTSVRSREATVYIDGQTMYLESDGQWRTRSLPDDAWSSGSRIEQQRQLLKNSEPTLVRNGTVDGEAVYVLRMEPNAERVADVIQSRGQSMQGAEIEDVTIVQYVDKETHRLRRMEMDMTMSAYGQTMTADAVITLSGYGEDVDVTVPQEASGATEAGTSRSVAAP